MSCDAQADSFGETIPEFGANNVSRMKKLLAVLFVVACLPACVGTQRLTADPEKWQLVWADEFSVPGAPNPKKWSYEEGFRRNRQLQYFTDRPENVRVENGHLVIEAIPESWPNDAYEKDSTDWRKELENAEYTSGAINTRGKASWTYGRIEIRLKISQGLGLHAAAWTLGDNLLSVGWPASGELDIMEYVGFQPDIFHTSVHTEAFNHVKRNHKRGGMRVPDAHHTFHVFAVEWDQDQIEFFVNGNSTLVFENEGTGNAEWPFDKPQYLVLDYAVGGNWAGEQGVDQSALPSKFLVDYIRVYKLR